MKVKKVTALLLSMAIPFLWQPAERPRQQTRRPGQRTRHLRRQARRHRLRVPQRLQVTGTVSKSARKNDNSSESGSDTLNYTGLLWVRIRILLRQ